MEARVTVATAARLLQELLGGGAALGGSSTAGAWRRSRTAVAQRNLLEGSSKRSRSDPKHTEPPIPDTPRCLPAVAACRPRGGAVCSRLQQKLTSRLHLNAARTAELKEEVVQQHRAGSTGLLVHAGSGCACVHCPMAASVDACPPAAAAGGVPQTPRAADPTAALLFASFKPSRAEPSRASAPATAHSVHDPTRRAAI